MTDRPSILHLNWDEPPLDRCRGGAVAVGNFDGVHRGHASLVRVLREYAANGPAVVLSFDPHPLALLAPERFQPTLNTTADRVRHLKDVGADEVCLLRTTPDLLRLSPIEFFERILRDGFVAKAVVEGFNFRFGRDRAGDTDMLAALCRAAGMRFALVPPFELDGGPVSSSRVRAALTAGDIREAERLMGRRYEIHGTVVVGAKRGRTLGFPTANLAGVETVLPADGVYAVRVRRDGQTWAGAANVGPNPTFGEHARKIEVHVIDFDGDLYGMKLDVEFVTRLRGTRSFSGPAELIDQLRRDVDEARKAASG